MPAGFRGKRWSGFIGDLWRKMQFSVTLCCKLVLPAATEGQRLKM